MQRAAQATRHLAEAAAPEAAAVDWIDLNALLRRVVQLMGYDKRYRHVVFDLQLDAGLPALQAPGDGVQQVLMQMLGLGCDALGRSGGPVQVGSRAAQGVVEVTLAFPATLDFADAARAAHAAAGARDHRAGTRPACFRSRRRAAAADQMGLPSNDTA